MVNAPNGTSSLFTQGEFVARSNPFQKQIRAARQSLRQLARTLDRLDQSIRLAPKADNGTGPRRRLRLTPRRKAELKLHGRYLGHIRLLKPAQKARVRSMREKKGYHAAIKLAKQLSGAGG
jgi:hypothetical protein